MWTDLLLFSLLFLLPFHLINATTTSIVNGLVGEFLFEGNAGDSSGNGNHGTVVGASLVTDRFGNANSAYSFNGMGNYIYFQGTPFAFSQNMTLSFWINPAQVPVDWTCIIDKTHSAVTEHYTGGYHFLYYKFGYYYYSFVTPSNSLGTQEGPYITFPLNTWTHVAVTKGKTIKYYVNGVMVIERPFDGNSGAMKTDSLPLMLGGCNYGGTSPPSGVSMYFKGKLDDVLVYNRKLSAAEISTLYHTGQPSALPTVPPSSSPSFSTKVPSPSPTFASLSPTNSPTMHPTTAVVDGLVGEFLFEGNAGDSSGNGNHGTVVGASLVTDRFGNANSAYSFNGMGNYIYFQGTPFAFSQDMTLSFWINPAQVPADWTCIIDKTHSAVTEHYTGGYHFLYYKSGYYYYSFVTPSNSLGTQEGPYITFPLNTWTHVAVTKGKTIKYYVNGVMVIERPFDGNSGAMKTDSLPLMLGGCNYGGTSPPSGVSMYFKGKLDDVLVYNRLLSSAEVTAIYSNTAVSSPSPSSNSSSSDSSSSGSHPAWFLPVIICCSIVFGGLFIGLIVWAYFAKKASVPVSTVPYPNPYIGPAPSAPVYVQPTMVLPPPSYQSYHNYQDHQAQKAGTIVEIPIATAVVSSSAEQPFGYDHFDVGAIAENL